MNPDLFPETLLVSREGDHIYTTSLKVAEHFKKQHAHVMRSVQNLLSDLGDESNFGAISGFGALNFEAATYTDQRNRQKAMYRLSHDGFALLAMGFTGRQALQWKIEFLNAFRTQERALAQLTARYAHALDVVRPCIRPVVEGTEQGLTRSTIAEPLGKSANAITYHRRKARELGLL
jgi:Rha family phage regulatory protein